MKSEIAQGSIRDSLMPLFELQSTDEFSKRVDELDKEAGANLFTEREWRSLTEALTLRDFAITVGAAECRLQPKEIEFPDAEAKFGQQHFKIEITEVMTPGRERYKEYKENRCTGVAVSVDGGPQKMREAGANWMTWMLEGIEKKLKYDNKIDFDLVVYNNISHLFELPEIDVLSNSIGTLLSKRGFNKHWVWQCRATTVDLLWPRLVRLKIPNWAERF